MLPTSSLAAIFSFSFLVGLAAVISPGPISTTIVSQAPRHGWLVGPLVATGHSALELLMVFLITLGSGKFVLSAVIGGGRRWMTDRLYRTLLVACGIFFLYLGLVFLSQEIAGLR